MKNIQRFHEFVLKVNLLDQNLNQIIGHVMNKVGNNLFMYIMCTNDNIKNVEIAAPEWNEEINF